MQISGIGYKKVALPFAIDDNHNEYHDFQSKIAYRMDRQPDLVLKKAQRI